jgi:serine/threonine protein kinase/tetratricopeptide (TPR) repeat protein
MKWQAVTEAFEKARTLPPGERLGFLRDYCGGDDDLRREAESLLKAYEESGDFLEDLAIDHAGRDALDSLPGSMIGARVGAYRITRRIGEGGMGEVFEAERADGEFRQLVAIKIVREDAGPSSRDARRHDRFRAERQILSDLSHPNIARLLDGGTTETGAPYLVMELIDGRPIDLYCASQGLSLDERTELFGKVCDAVEYANRRNVIHCDIKPANILVTAEGVPKLLDFGISRLGMPLNATQTRAATPEYASPEQLAGQKLTPATDIYSLGVVLRKIAPSLTTIIDRATRPQSADRYPSAAALGEAVRNQVAAKWKRRGILAASVGILAGGAAGGFTWWRLRGTALGRNDALAVMRIENRTGDRELDWADRGIADLLATNFAQAGGFEVISTTRSRELLDRTGSNQRQAADLARAGYYVTGDLLRVGNGLRLNLRVEQTSSGRIQVAEKFDGENWQAIIGMADQASAAILAQLRAASDVLPSAGRALSSNPEALRLYEEGCDYLDRWQIPKAREALNRAIAIDPQFAMAYFRLASTKPWSPPESLRDLDRASDLAARLNLPRRERQMLQASRLDVAGRTQESAAIVREMIRQNPRDAEARTLLAEALCEEGDFSGAWSESEEGLAQDPGSRFLLMMNSYAGAMAGRFREALESADRYTATLKPGDWNGLDMRGDVLSMAERFDEAIDTYAKVDRTNKLSLAAMHKGDFDRAESELKKLVGRHAGPVAMGGWLGFLGDVQVARGDLDGARTWFEQGVRAYGNFEWYGALVMWKAAQVYLEQGRPEVVLELTTSLSDYAWSPGIRSVALTMMGKTADAKACLAALRTSVGAMLGDYLGARHEELYRLWGAFYRGEHQKVAATAEHAPRVLWHLYSLAAGRSNLALGNLDAAERHLVYTRKMGLNWSAPGTYEAHNFLAFLLCEFYLGQLAARRGRTGEARRKFDFFLQCLGHSSARLPQIAEAR